jgi:hypothetical protein
MSAEVRVGGERLGATEAYGGEVLTLVLARPYAPGAPLHFTVEASTPLELTGKSLGSKRREDGRFTVRLRLTNLRRDERRALEALHPG